MGTETLDVARMYCIRIEIGDDIYFTSEYSCLDEDDAAEWFIEEFGGEIGRCMGRVPCADDIEVELIGYSVYDEHHCYDFYFKNGYEGW